ncbi:MAG: acyl-CoA dehydrogenase family protein [Thermoleophilia bacterium]
MYHVTFSDEQQAIIQMVRDLMVEQVAPRTQEIDERGEYPHWLAELFQRYDLFGVAVPEEYGGVDGLLVTQSAVLEQVARVSGACSMILGVQCLGSAPIALFGDEAQKQRWLSRLATGEIKVAFGLTEPNAGSDVRGMTTRAVPRDDGWLLNGRKSFISHANIADVVVCFAQTKTAEGEEISAFLVETDRDGFEVDKIEHKMGLRGSPTCSLVLEDVWVPGENVLGEVGHGMGVALGTLYKSRICSAAQSLGVAQGALDIAAAYVQDREQFGRPLSRNPVVQSIVGRMVTQVEAARSLVYTAAARYDDDLGEKARFSSMAKLFASDTAMRVSTDAVQIMGGYGYMVEYGVEQFMRDAKVFQIFEGANELHETGIAREFLGGK